METALALDKLSIY